MIPNQKLRQTFKNTQANLGVGGPNLFAVAAMETAYKHEICENWLDSLLQYLKGNLNFLKDYIKEKHPQIKVIEPEGTYLVWLDFRELGLEPNIFRALTESTWKPHFFITFWSFFVIFSSPKNLYFISDFHFSIIFIYNMSSIN